MIFIANKRGLFLSKIKKGITVTNANVTNAILKISKESNRLEAKSKGLKTNKIWVDKGSEFYNRSMESWLEKNDIEMYSTRNEGKSVVAEIFIRTL